MWNQIRVVDLLNGVGSSRAEVGIIIRGILDCFPSSQVQSFSFVPRASNSVAHALARLALSLSNGSRQLSEVPICVQHLILNDCQAAS
ncbi:hypothetical protein ACOSP7_025695 [Xanthoceras sorbifolium]